MCRAINTRSTKVRSRISRCRGRQTKRAVARRWRDRQRRLGQIISSPRRDGNSKYRFEDKDKVRSRQLIWSNWQLVLQNLERNRPGLRSQTITPEMLVLAHLTVCKSSVTANDFTRIEECGRDAILGMWRFHGFTFPSSPGSVVRVVREILVVLGLIERIDATWSRRTHNQPGRCQRWIPTGQSWSLPMFTNIDPAELTPAQRESFEQYEATQYRRQQYANTTADTTGLRGLGDEGVRLSIPQPLWGNHSGENSPETYQSSYWPEPDDEEGICTNLLPEAYLYYGGTAYVSDYDELGPPAGADWDVEHYAYEDYDDWAQAFDWDAYE